MFLVEFPCSFHDPTDIGNLISRSSAFSKSSLHIYLEVFASHTFKPIFKDFEHNLPSMWNECSCVVIWTFFGIALLWDWNVPVLWPLLSFPNLLTYWLQHSNSIFFGFCLFVCLLQYEMAINRTAWTSKNYLIQHVTKIFYVSKVNGSNVLCVVAQIKVKCFTIIAQKFWWLKLEV